jgi:lysozyme family protein
MGADLVTYDCCVNSGASRALTFARRALGLGPGTATAIANQVAMPGTDVAAFIKKSCAARRSFLIGLRNSTYEKGWLRRVADVEATGLAWFLAAEKPKSEAVSLLSAEAASADRAATANKGSAGGAGAGGAAAAGHSAATGSFDWIMWTEIGLTAALVLLTAYFAYKFYVQRHRGVAMRGAVAELQGGDHAQNLQPR